MTPETLETCAAHDAMTRMFEKQMTDFDKKLDMNSAKLDEALNLLHKGAEANVAQTILIEQLQKDLAKEEIARKSLELKIDKVQIDATTKLAGIQKLVWMALGGAGLLSILLPTIITLAINWEKLVG